MQVLYFIARLDKWQPISGTGYSTSFEQIKGNTCVNERVIRVEQDDKYKNMTEVWRNKGKE